MKTILTRSLAVVAMLTVFLGPGLSLADVLDVTTPALPAGYTVIPSNDADRSDDQIVQLENLTIRSMSSARFSFPMIIYASRDLGGTCREYFDVSGGSGSRVYPCPLAPTVLYQITLQSDTILLLKNRSRATTGDFAVGDRINVFGFMDGGTSGVQALIVRDLDKPAASSQYVQLNDLTVITPPDSSMAPATLRVANRGIERCLSFASVNSASGVTAPCPLGDIPPAMPTESMESVAPGSQNLTMPPFAKYYTVHVSSLTRLMNVNRQSIGLSAFQAGDKVNIYGRYNSTNRTIEALIIRDLSIPRSVINNSVTLRYPNGGETLAIGNTALISWSFNPSTIPNGYAIVLSLLDGPSQGATIATLDSSAANQQGYKWQVQQVVVGGDAVTNIEPGRYRIKIELYDGMPCLGFCAQPLRAVKLITSDVSNATFEVVKSLGDSSGVPSITSVSPAEGWPGTKVTLKGKFARSGNYVYVGGANAGNDVSSDGTTLSFTIPEYVSPCSYNPYEQKEPVYCAAVAMQMPTGNQRVNVVNANGKSNSVLFNVWVPQAIE